MTRPDASSSVPNKGPARDDALETTAAAEPLDVEPEPEPEPWTPARVTEWNAYYDLYVMGAALLLAFVVSAVLANNAPLWSNLKVGRQIIAQSSPVVRDAFSYTEEGKRWVNIPWLFQASHAAVHDLAASLVPTDPDDPTANRASAARIAVGALVALAALARLATAFVLLRIRRKGPGLWWTALCAVLAVGAVVGPAGLMLGGIAQPGPVSPATWGILCLALEFLFLYKALGEGRTWGLYALVPLFLVWANLDESFAIGLLALAAATLGRLLDGRGAEALVRHPAGHDALVALGYEEEDEPARSPVSASAIGAVLIVCALVCLANPSTYRIYSAAIEPVADLFERGGAPPTFDQLSYFGPTIRAQFPGWYRLTIYYLVVVGVGAASFLLNRARFSWARFLPYAAVAVAWGVYMRYSPEFAIVWASVMALNGQEWYQRRFGIAGKLGTGWTVWSTGGRLVTLAALFYFVSVAITGYGKPPGASRFGFGFDRDEFAFEAAEYLAAHDDIAGNVFNWSASQGDAIVWKAGPARKTFLDSRSRLFPAEIQLRHHELRNALRDDDESVWRPAFDQYNITAVMIDSESAVNTYARLMQSPAWIPFYDDGKVVMFGRSDAPEPDRTAFESNRLDPELRAYKVVSPPPQWDRPPMPVYWMDDIFQSRALTPPRHHNNAARRWLSGAASTPDQPAVPDPARCLLAIREARAALGSNPDDHTAYRLLALAYNLLIQQETALLAGIPLDPEHRDQAAALPPNLNLLSTLSRQRLAALNFAIQTTPPPKNLEERQALLSLHFDLYSAYLQLGFVDLARDHLQAALNLAEPEDMTQEVRLQQSNQLTQLNERVKQIENVLNELQIERQAGPIEKAQYALGQGAPGLALIEFEEADRANMAPMIVKPQLIELYCATGQPDRALEQLAEGGADDSDPNQPGSAGFRQGQVYQLLGNYASATTLWRERAIPRLAYSRTFKALSAGQRLLLGEAAAATTDNLSLPGMVDREAVWEYELGRNLLESGDPVQAAEHLSKALKLAPDLAYRPLIAYYLERIGEPVPPPKADANANAASAPKREPEPAAAKPDEADAAEAKDETPE